MTEILFTIKRCSYYDVALYAYDAQQSNVYCPVANGVFKYVRNAHGNWPALKIEPQSIIQTSDVYVLDNLTIISAAYRSLRYGPGIKVIYPGFSPKLTVIFSLILPRTLWK